MSTATHSRTENGTSPAVRPSPAIPATRFSLDDIWRLAEQVARSKFFPGIDTPEKAFTLMCLCESEGLHPMQAVRRFHVIQGRPAMMAAAIQAEFLLRGGRIELVETSPARAAAYFSHPQLQPQKVLLEAVPADYKHLLGKDNWKFYPADMLWARLVSKGVRKIDPGVIVGIGSVDEAEDALTIEAHLVHNLPPAPTPAIEAARSEAFGPTLPGQSDGPDDRPYHQVVSDAAKAENAVLAGAVNEALPGLDPKTVVKLVSLSETHAHLLNRAIQSGYDSGDVPQKNQERIQRLTRVYKERRGWLRSELLSYLEGVEREARDAIVAMVDARGQDAAETENQDPRDDDPSVTGVEPPKRSREPGEEG